MSSYDKFKEELTKLDRADWSEVEDLVLQGRVNDAIEALLPLVPDAARAYAKAVAVHAIDFDDVIAMGNLALVEAVQGWRPGGESLRNWAYKKVSREIGRMIGKELSFGVTHEDELDAEDEEVPREDLSHLDNKISAGMVQDWILENLSEREAEIVQLVYFHDMSLRKIAQNQGVSTEAISKVHRRALSKIRAGVDTF